MISARDALLLPSARLKPLKASDAEGAQKILTHADAYVRENMQWGGCTIPVDANLINDDIAKEVLRVCRQKGWNGGFQQTFREVLGVQQVVWQLVLQPRNEEYDIADAVADADAEVTSPIHLNGVPQ